MNKKLILTFLLIIAVLIAGCTAAEAVTGQAAPQGDLVVSGFIEARSVDLSTEIGGRVAALPVEEGQVVRAGDVLINLDTDLLAAQREVLAAQVAIAEAQRDQLAAGARPEIIAQGQAQVALAQAAVDAASVALGGAAALYNNPQELEIQVIDAQTQVAVAQEQVTAARVQFSKAEEGLQSAEMAVPDIRDAQDQFEPLGLTVAMPLDVATAPYRFQQAQTNLLSTIDALDGAQAALAALQQLADNPQGYQAQIAAASGQLETARAGLDRAGAELALLEAGPRDEDLAIADARIEQAQAAVDALDIQIERATITSPIDGIVLERALHIGELAVPGITAMTIANLETVDITVYLQADELPRAELNDAVSVYVDTYPDVAFTGTVIEIADEAEFTPRTAQTREERVNLVYAITIRVQNPDGELKPGQPADVAFE